MSRSLALLPLVGRPAALSYMALVNAYYAYEWIFANRDWALARRCAYIGDRAAYMFGFGEWAGASPGLQLCCPALSLIAPAFVQGVPSHSAVKRRLRRRRRAGPRHDAR